MTPHIGHEHINSGYYDIMNLPQPFSEKVIKVVDKINEISKTSGIKGLKGATGFIKPEEWDAKKTSLKKVIQKTTGYLLLERIDFLDTAQQLVKRYKLKSRVKFTKGADGRS